MRISRKAEYALRALFLLAGARPDRPVGATEIARREGIPEKFLDQVLLALRREGWLESRRGVGGGWVLARSADDITVGEVLRALDGPLAPLPCAQSGAAGEAGVRQCGCPHPRDCTLRAVMGELAREMSERLDGLSLAAAREQAGAAAEVSFDI